jgi:hypothetical protein
MVCGPHNIKGPLPYPCAWRILWATKAANLWAWAHCPKLPGLPQGSPVPPCPPPAITSGLAHTCISCGAQVSRSQAGPGQTDGGTSPGATLRGAWTPAPRTCRLLPAIQHPPHTSHNGLLSAWTRRACSTPQLPAVHSVTWGRCSADLGRGQQAGRRELTSLLPADSTDSDSGCSHQVAETCGLGGRVWVSM